MIIDYLSLYGYNDPRTVSTPPTENFEEDTVNRMKQPVEIAITFQDAYVLLENTDGITLARENRTDAPPMAQIWLGDEECVLEPGDLFWFVAGTDSWCIHYFNGQPAFIARAGTRVEYVRRKNVYAFEKARQESRAPLYYDDPTVTKYIREFTVK